MPRRTATAAALDALLRAQDGLVTHRQVARVGMARGWLQHRLRSGAWLRLLPQVYLAAPGPPTERQRLLAAVLHGGPGTLLDSVTAARLHALRYLPADPRVHICVPRQRRPRTDPTVVVHRVRTSMPSSRVGGLPVVCVARAVVMAAADGAGAGGDGLRPARAIVADAVQRRLASPAELAAAAAGVRGAGVLRRVLAEIEAGARSAPEAELLALLRRSGLPAPLLNHDVVGPDGQFLARADAYWPAAGVVVEVDSKEWHLSASDWEATMRRHNRLTRAGYLVLHFPPSRIRTSPDEVVAEIRAALHAATPTTAPAPPMAAGDAQTR